MSKSSTSGLTVDEAIGRSMESETYERDRALPARILPRLTGRP